LLGLFLGEHFLLKVIKYFSEGLRFLNDLKFLIRPMKQNTNICNYKKKYFIKIKHELYTIYFLLALFLNECLNLFAFPAPTL